MAESIRSGQSQGENPVSNLLFDWVSVMHSKAKGLQAYEKYIEDARAAGADKCVSMFEKLRKQDIQMLGEVKEHLAKIMSKQAQRQGQESEARSRQSQSGSSSRDSASAH